MISAEQELRECADNGYVDRLRDLIAEGGNLDAVNSRGFSALFYAMNRYPHLPDKPYLDVVKTLVEGGANINISLKNNQTPLYDAARNGLYDVVVYMHQQGAEINTTLTTGANVLHDIAIELENRIVSFSVTMADTDGEAVTLTDPEAVREAVGGHPDDDYRAYLEIVQYLLDHGIDVNARTHESNQPPLHHFASSGVPEVCAMLIGAGMDNINHQDTLGVTALHYASRNGHLQTVRVLVNAGADVNIQENYGFSPLHEAAEYGHLEVVKALVEAGADVKLGLTKGYDLHKPGSTPLDVAKAAKQKAVIGYLGELGK